MKLLSWILIPFGALLLAIAIVVSIGAGKRDVPEDGLKAAQSVTATVLGFERDIQCEWGDDGVRTEADRSLGQDDGRVHDHWMCDSDKVVLRSAPGGYEAGSNAAILAEKIGPGTEFVIMFVVWALGGLGLFVTWERGR